MALEPQYKTQEEVPEAMKDHYTEFKRKDGTSVWKLQVTGSAEGWQVANTKSILEDLEKNKASVTALTSEKEALAKEIEKSNKALEAAKKAPGEREADLEATVNNAKAQNASLQARLDELSIEHKLSSAFVQRLTPDPADGNGKSDLLGTFSPLDLLRAKVRDRIRLDRGDDGSENLVVLTEKNGKPATRIEADGVTQVPVEFGDLIDAAFESEQFKKMLPSSVASPQEQPPRSGITGEPTVTKSDTELAAQISR